MNVHDRDIATPKVTTGPIAGSRKVHAVPEAASDLRVPVREIVLTDAAAEPPVPVYDTSGPYTDNNVAIDVEAGLKRTRVEWVRERDGIEEYEGRAIQPVDNGNVSGKHLARAFPTAHRPLRGTPTLPSPASGGGEGRGITQYEWARAGIPRRAPAAARSPHPALRRKRPHPRLPRERGRGGDGDHSV